MVTNDEGEYKILTFLDFRLSIKLGVFPEEEFVLSFLSKLNKIKNLRMNFY